MSTCISCGAPILWRTTMQAKKMPVDEAPSSAGNLILMDDEHVRHANVTDPQGDRWTSHFATCPKAAHHRRRDAPTRGRPSPR